MQTRWLGMLTAVVIAVPGVASAVDAPHDASFSDGNCDNCHTLADVSAGGKLDTSRGCVTCHNGIAKTSFGFPWLSTDQGQAGANGTSHSWSGFASNPRHGARLPTTGSAYDKLVEGKLQCATCHEPHHAAPGSEPSSMHTSIPVNVAVDESGGTATSSQMTLVTPGTAAKGYRLKIQADGTSFVISHDFGLAIPSWFNWSGSAWVAGTAAGAGRPFVVGTAVALDDPAVTVKWSAGAVSGSFWDFYVSYPFLRIGNANDAVCLDCHAERSMNHVRVSGDDANYRPNGVRLFSHPVGVAMGANGGGYDRTIIRDANGAGQDAGDGDKSNDLVLDDGIVRCTTCHAVHNADSNSLTPDAR